MELAQWNDERGNLEAKVGPPKPRLKPKPSLRLRLKLKLKRTPTPKLKLKRVARDKHEDRCERALSERVISVALLARNWSSPVGERASIVDLRVDLAQNAAS